MHWSRLPHFYSFANLCLCISLIGSSSLMEVSGVPAVLFNKTATIFIRENAHGTCITHNLALFIMGVIIID